MWTGRMRAPGTKRKSKLSDMDKAVVSARVVLDAHAGLLDEPAAARRLRESFDLQWSFITCLQYLSGKKAIAAISALPSDWSADGRTKKDMITAVLLAADAVAHA